LQPGETVLDLGCGAGMDTILCARLVGPQGQVHSLDLSTEMLESARANITAAELENVTFHQAPAEAVPIGDDLVDVVLVNGIFNLCPNKEMALKEVFRTLRPGGRLLVSEIVLAESDEESWVGATCDLGGGRLSGLSLENWFQ
jgi:arsenite methyltransferase